MPVPKIRTFLVNCETQEEVDYCWSTLTVDGGEEGRCGWLKESQLRTPMQQGY